MLYSFGSQGILDEEPNIQMNVKAEVGGAEQEGFARPVLVDGGRGVVAAGLPENRAEFLWSLFKTLALAVALPCHPCFLLSVYCCYCSFLEGCCPLPADSAGDGPAS